MDERMLARRSVAGDLNSFGQLYDGYFPRVYDFAWRLLLDADAAASVAEEVFDEAVRTLGVLREARDVAPWLFAIAYRRALPRAGRRGEDADLAPQYEEAFGAFATPDPAALRDRSVIRGDEELAVLVWEAATLLNPRDYALLDLHLRQDLDGGELAAVMAVSRNAATNIVSRLEHVAEDAFAGYVLARRGGAGCDGLRQVLQEHPFPPYGDDTRTAVEAHIAECEGCKSTRSNMPRLTDVFVSLAFVEPPLDVKGRVWRNIASSWSMVRGGPSFVPPAPGRAPIPAPIDGDGGGGGDFSLIGGGDGDGEKPWLLFAGAVAGLLLFAFMIGGAIMVLTGGDDTGDAGAVAETRTVVATDTAGPDETNVPGVDVEESPTPDVTETPTPEATDTPPPPPPPTATPTLPPPPPATATPNIRTVGPAPSPTSPPAVLPTSTPAPGGTAVPTP